MRSRFTQVLKKVAACKKIRQDWHWPEWGTEELYFWQTLPALALFGRTGWVTDWPTEWIYHLNGSLKDNTCRKYYSTCICWLKKWKWEKQKCFSSVFYFQFRLAFSLHPPGRSQKLHRDNFPSQVFSHHDTRVKQWNKINTWVHDPNKILNSFQIISFQLFVKYLYAALSQQGLQVSKLSCHITFSNVLAIHCH